MKIITTNKSIQLTNASGVTCTTSPQKQVLHGPIVQPLLVTMATRVVIKISAKVVDVLGQRTLVKLHTHNPVVSRPLSVLVTGHVETS